jgi:hypothetical protein
MLRESTKISGRMALYGDSGEIRGIDCRTAQARK